MASKTFNAKMLSSKQKAQLAKTGSFTTSTGAKKDSSGKTVSSSSKTSTTTKDYTLHPGETVAEWNARTGGNASVVGPNADGTLGLTAAQVASLKTMPGIDQTLLANYQPTTLAKATAPTSPLAMTQMDPTAIPAMPSSVVNPAGAIAVSSGMQAYMDAIQKQLEQQQARNDKMAKENQSLMEKTLGTMKNPEDVYNQAWEDTGMSAREYFATQEAGVKEIESLNNEYATVQAAMEQQIAQSNDKMASMNFINNQTAQIRRNAEPQLNTISAKISSKAATLQALQGNFAEARSLVRDAVDAATAGNKFKYDMYQALYEQNQDNFDRVDKAYSEAYSNAMNLALKDYEMQRAEKMQIGELLLANPQAGIDMNDSLDEAFEKVGLSPMSPQRRLLEAQIANTWANAAGSGAAGATGSQVEDSSEVANDGGELSQLFSLVVGSSGSVTETKRQISQFNQYLKNGNVEAAQQMVNTLAVKNMTAEQRNKFIGFGSISSAVDSVSQIENQFRQTNPGLYKTILESAKPFVGASTDPAWQSFVAQTQNAINAYRNEIFGASLTGNELKAANISLPDWNRDTAGTIFTKLNAMKSYADTVRESAIRNTTGQYTSPALGQTVTPQAVIENTSIYDSITGQQSDGGWFSKFLGWFR